MSEPIELVEGDQPLPYGDDDLDPLVIRDETGEVIFAIRHDGVVQMPDPAKAPLAAAVFWREVMAMADMLDIMIKVKSR